MERGEYELEPAPPGYTRAIEQIVLSGAIAVVSLVVLLAALGSARVAASVVTGALLGLAGSTTWLVRTVRARSRDHPDWREFHEKQLPPKPNPALLGRGLSLATTDRLHRSDRLLSWVFAAIGVAILVALAVMGARSLPLAVLGAAMAGICGWNLSRMRRIAIVSGPSQLVADARGLTVPVAAFEVIEAGRLARRGLGQRTLRWQEIREWIVESGGSDDPDLYRIEETDGKTTRLYRRGFVGREIDLLEYVRAAGVPVRLKDSVTSSR